MPGKNDEQNLILSLTIFLITSDKKKEVAIQKAMEKTEWPEFVFFLFSKSMQYQQLTSAVTVQDISLKMKFTLMCCHPFKMNFYLYLILICLTLNAHIFTFHSFSGHSSYINYTLKIQYTQYNILFHQNFKKLKVCQKPSAQIKFTNRK